MDPPSRCPEAQRFGGQAVGRRSPKGEGDSAFGNSDRAVHGREPDDDRVGAEAKAAGAIVPVAVAAAGTPPRGSSTENDSRT